MGAISIRAGIEQAEDYYLMPLPATIAPREVLESYLEPVWEQAQTLEPIYRCNSKGESEKIAEGFEIIETMSFDSDGQTVTWQERRLVIRSIKHTQSQERALNKRLQKAKKAINDLTRSRSGYKRIKTLDLFWPAVNNILKQYKVEGLLEVDAVESSIEHYPKPLSR